jgi:hypothetical protein
MTATRRRPTLTRLCLYCAVVALAVTSAPYWGAADHCNPGTPRVSVTPGFFTGEELNSMSDDQLGMYAAGYVDAFQAATMVGIREQCRQALQTCVSGQDRADFVAAIRKYLREHPNWWHERSNGILYNVLFSQCLRH